MPDREKRIAQNETTFRNANERLRGDWDAMGLSSEERTLFICECGDATCTEVMSLTLAEYEAVRSDANTFAVVPGHDDKPTERIVTQDVADRNERFAVVRKRGEYREITESSDPR